MLLTLIGRLCRILPKLNNSINFLNFNSSIDDNLVMRTLKGISTFMVLVLLLQSCMPDSLTKFKEESAKKEEVVQETEEAPPTFTDSNGNVITSDDLLSPTSITYADQIIKVGDTVSIVPGGALNDLTPVLNDITNKYELEANMGTNFSPVYTTTPTLPVGLSIDTQTGVISGVVSSPINLTNYTVTLTFNDPSNNTPTTINDSVNYTFEEEIPDDFRITYDVAVVTKKLGVQLADNSNFETGVTNIASKDGATATLTLTDDNNFVFTDVTAGEFKIGDEIDNSATFTAPESTVSSLTYFYEVNGAVNLVAAASSTSAIDSSQNGVTYQVSPDLPVGLTINTSTGAITGAVAAVTAEKEYTVTISNNTYTKSFPFSLSITEAPRALSFSNTKVLPVASVTSFQVGDDIAGNFAAPLTAGGIGEVVFIDTINNNLVVKVKSGDFELGQAVDQSATYIDEETKITAKPQPITAILNVATPTNFDDYYDDTGSERTDNPIICQTTTAKATVTYKSGNLLFIAQTKAAAGNWAAEYIDNGGALASGSVFNESGTDCDVLNTNNATDVEDGAPIGITNIWSPSMEITLDAIGGFRVGQDVITASNSTGYISEVAGSVLTVIPSSTVYFNETDPIGFTRPYVAAQTLTQTSTNLKFELAVGEDTQIKPFLLTGQDIRYTVNNDLPKGLTLDNLTGIITGKPEETLADSTYQITAQNIIGSETIVINIEVNDYFEIIDDSGAPTYALHKLGQANNSAKCRINKKDISNFQANRDPLDIDTVDIDCFLDGGEKDINQLGLKLTSKSGPAVCNFVDYTPFGFRQFPSTATNPTTIRYAKITTNSCEDHVANDSVLYLSGTATLGDVAGAFDGVPIFSVVEETICQSKYSDGKGGYVNCDQGSYIIDTYEIVEDDAGTGNGTCTYIFKAAAEETDCAGNSNKCIQGPVRDLFSDVDSNGYRGVTIFANPGLERSFEIKGPNDNVINTYSSSTNLGVANYVGRNSCPDRSINNTDYKSNGWASAGNSPFIHPYYTFECKDGAEDTMARIRVMVREWDRDFNRTDIDQVFSGIMDDSTLNLFGTAYNEINDWDDVTNSYTGCTDSVNASPVIFNNHVQSIPSYFTGTAGTPTLTADAGQDLTSLLVNPDTVTIYDGVNTETRTILNSTYNSVTKVTTVTLTANLANTYNGAFMVEELAPSTSVITMTRGERTVTGAGTAFLSTLKAGMTVTLTNAAFTAYQTVTVRSVNSNTQFTAVEPILTDDVNARMQTSSQIAYPWLYGL